MRAGGAGIAGFYTRTGIGTMIAQGKEVREFAGKPHLLETGIVADLAIVKAWKADAFGNLVFRKSVDANIINAGKQTITELDRTSYVSSAESFGMIRGGHIDLSVQGAIEVAENGDLANWMVPGKTIKGPGGAMDLVAGVPCIIVLMDHVDKLRGAKFRRRCTLPLTGANVVDMIITNLALSRRSDRVAPFALVEVAPGVSASMVRDCTEAYYIEDLA